MGLGRGPNGEQYDQGGRMPSMSEMYLGMEAKWERECRTSGCNCGDRWKHEEYGR